MEIVGDFWCEERIPAKPEAQWRSVNCLVVWESLTSIQLLQHRGVWHWQFSEYK